MLRAIGSRIAVARLPALLFSRISAVQLVRAYAASAGLARADVEARVLAVVKNTPKIAADKVTATSHFVNDLGLDSLDTVEVVMAIEDEFAIQIPDEDAEKIQTTAQAIEYIVNHKQAK